MIVEHNFLPLFEKFIAASRTGKRCKKNGERINKGTIKNYENTLRLLLAYCESKELMLYELKGNNKSDFDRSKKHYRNFYKGFCDFLIKHHDAGNNYLGHNIKIIRIFFNWCNHELGINTGPFHKSFYVLNEEIPIITLSIEQLNFLIYDNNFEQSLPLPLQKAKDTFVFGCATGLRISDLRRLRIQHVVYRDGYTYINISSKKVGYETLVKLPPFCIDIINKYKKTQKTLLPIALDSRFNARIKQICESAGWTWYLPKYRKIGSRQVELKKGNKQYRFCDMVSSHTMRRTCITNMLYAGMPEHVVRKISGHVGNSKSFFRYVELAQKLVDEEINKLFDRLQPGPAKTPVFAA